MKKREKHKEMCIRDSGKPVHFRLVLLPVGVQIGEGGDVMLRHIAYLCGNLIPVSYTHLQEVMTYSWKRI